MNETDTRQRKIYLRASRIARDGLIIVSAVLVLVVGYLTYAVSPIGPLNIDPSSRVTGILRFAGLCIFWVLLVLQTLNLVLGFMPKVLLERFEPLLAKRIAKWLTVGSAETVFTYFTVPAPAPFPTTTSPTQLWSYWLVVII